MTTKRDGLRPTQEHAILALASGKTITAAAETAGVERQTLSRWVNHEANFQAALNQARKDQWRECQDQARFVTGKALAVITELLDDPEHQAAVAMDVLRLLSRLNLAPAGETNPRIIQMEKEWDAEFYDI